ncbi:hypothetical protein DU475_07975 [Rhodopseudomonas sp. WA056]|uniref:hypothetical protein n=1 Tax=Rhodopseudomonas sp. WA056 TaxID=2269367 RepID=UPI0013E01EA0|nr:hypothetical protein [Rhodopseudomonas sp. WA056]NEW87197.1 hypothetical protein [Rhodopseudomonas sp. WA056]
MLVLAAERPATMARAMKRFGIFLFYLVGAIAFGYLALYAYAMLTAPKLTPGEPIRIFRNPDAPKYS